MRKTILLLKGTALCCLLNISVHAQTDIDGIMMSKNNFCTGLLYGYSSWKNYWEGTYKRDNANLGTVSTQMLGVMGNYGITNKLNFLFGVPYVKTKASAGQLHGMEGIQDLSLWLKWMPIQKSFGKTDFTFYTIAGYSFPVGDYTPDFLPLSIGLRSKSLSLRGMVDYQVSKWFGTFSGTFVFRDNIRIDRDSYYTTELHFTNEVNMPNATQFNLRAGYRTYKLIAEAVVNKWTTLGGFDITKNNMPFPSNEMNMTTVGAHFKYETPFVQGLSLIGGADYTVQGRNVGQAASYNAGIFYVINFKPHAKDQCTDPKHCTNHKH